MPMYSIALEVRVRYNFPRLARRADQYGRCLCMPRTYRTVLDACVRQWGQIITRNLRGETEKYAEVGGLTQLDFINITISSNRVMGYAYICIHTVKVRILTTMCICNHFPLAPYKQYCPTIVIVYVCPQIYANDST